MPVLPTPGASTDTWGDELNDWLDEDHSSTGRNLSVSYDVNQSSHGFSVGDVLKVTGSNTYAKAKADAAANAEVVGVVSVVIDTNNFTLLVTGILSGLTSLTAGTTYFLSSGTAGALTATEPSTTNEISKPLLIAINSTTGVFINMRGAVVL